MSNSTCAACRPGWKSSEFWLCLAAVAVGSVMSSGILPAAGAWMKALGIAATVLGALGYTASRTLVKNSEAHALHASPPENSAGE